MGTPSAGGSFWGQLDIVGELLVWNLDWFNTSYVDPCTDCAYLAPLTERVFRGGIYFDIPSDYLFSASRFGNAPANRFNSNGVRCARAP